MLGEQIYEAMKNDISLRKILKDGSRLLPEGKLAARYGISVGTLRKVTARLEEEKILERVQGCGTFVREPDGRRATDFAYASLFTLHNQSEIDNALFSGSELSKRTSYHSLAEDEFAKTLRSYDLVFFSPRQVFFGHHDSRLAELPRSLSEKIEADYSPEILERFRATDTGSLFGVPVVANPVVFYLNRTLFEKNGIPLPESDWTWTDFLEICRAFKAKGIPPFLLLANPGYILEPFLYQAGGELFNRYGKVSLPPEPFRRFYNLFRTLGGEELVIDAYALPRAFPLEFADGVAPMTLGTPLLGPKLPGGRRGEFRYHPMPGNLRHGSCLMTFALGVPGNSRKKEETLDFLEHVIYDRNMSGISQVYGTFPARRREQSAWDGAGLENAAAVRESAEHAVPMPYKQGMQTGSMVICRRILSIIESGEPEETVRQSIETFIRNAVKP